ncbi:hypothetical protein [Polaromonas naphthalenivorans]|uniref:hypothetical protein n=1 Tax=Polaromonas naphthalenivorans TaxID=216465 RepID=UPI0012ED2388|nr:hypothetical protein [Polaromonas naphthalenivorans]
MKTLSNQNFSEASNSAIYLYTRYCMTKKVGLEETNVRITSEQYSRLESAKEDDLEFMALLIFEEAVVKIQNFCKRILAACKASTRPGRAHRRAIDFLLGTLWQTFEEFSSIKEPTLAQMAEHLASLGDDYGSNGEIGGITVYLKGGREYLEFNMDGTWLTVDTLLDIIEDGGDVPIWWQHGWTKVRRNNEWIAREELY